MVVWYKLKPKQLTAAGVAQLETSMHQREFCELTACPRAEQIPCICIELTGHRPCLSVVCLWYVSGIVSLSLHLSSWMGIFGLVLVMFFHNLDQYLMQKHCFRFVLESGNSIPRSLSNDHLVWIWCSLSYLLPASLKNEANGLSMFYRCLRFRL